MDAEALSEKFSDLYESSKQDLDQSESKLKSRFHKSEILEGLGYEDEDIKVEKSDERGKRTDIHCTDEYGNISFVIEFKKPEVDVSSSKRKKQLVDRYMKPLKADFGILYNGLKVVAYTREGASSKHLFTKRADELGDKAKEIIKFGQKPDYSLTKIENVRDYFEKFDDQEEKLKLEEESARQHFFENFKLEENSSFESLLISTIDLFEEMKGENQFLDSAFRFWKESYAKKPEEVPSSWENIMTRSSLSGESDLYEFMFCLETSYAVFARLIMAKSGEDYDFSDANFSKFIETEVDRASKRGDIAGASWAKVTQELIGDMRDNLVSSVFEEDIFYWWTEPYEDRSYTDLFHVKSIPNETISFGKSLGKITLMIYKFNFSRIDGDPLGVLYQQYFDKETRKALGEFYTPQEVVDYILDSVDYEGRKVLDKRLLDPACGSGTFPVTALQRYLKAAESSGKAEEEGWDQVLDELCNQYHIVGFDIHPFATIMAQIQFMLVLMPYYKKAIEDAKARGEHFKIQRIPIFRTDSLKDESQGESPTLDQFEEGEKFKMDVKLPVNKEEGGEFFDEEFAMPTPQAARKVGLHNNQQYFGALQAFFDVIKEQAEEMEDREEIPQFAREDFEDRLRKYSLTDKDWHKISTLFQSFADDLLTQINRLQSEFDDGRLIKSIEDIYLAALLKNEQDYNYVVGNPPYVRKEAIPTETKEALKERYPDTYSGNADLYVYFISRGIDWLSDNGKLGYVTSNKFTKTDYGEGVRKKITEETKILEYSNFERSNFFTDVTAYPCIFALENRDSADKYDIKVILAEGDPEEISSVTDKIREDLKKGKTVDRDYYSAYKTSSEDLGQREWRFIPKQANEVFQKLDRRKTDTLEGVTREISAGIKTGMNSVFVLNRDKAQKLGLEQDVLKPILRGSDIKRFNFEPAEEFVVYTEGIDIESHPETKDYLAQYKDKLANRSDGAFKGKEWYELNIPHSREIMDERKLVCPDISEENNFALDEQGRYILNTAYLILPEEEYEDKLKVLLGVLNSKPTEFYLKQISPPLRGGYHRYITKYLEPLPLILGDSKDEAIQEKVTEIRNIGITEDRVKNFPYGYDKEQEKEVKTLECNSGHPDMEPSIQTTQDGMFEVEVGKRKTDSVLLDSKEKARFVKKTLEGDSASKGEEIEILVPRSNSDVKQILQEYEEDKEKLEEMPSVEELEEEINEIVYDLYDLDEEDIEVIEDFLEKF